MRLVGLLALSLVAATGCGADPAAQPAPPPAPAAAPTETRHAGTVYVQERDDGRPRIGPVDCALPAIGGDYPPGPLCNARIPLAAWDWNAVEREERVPGVVWGMYRVVGTYDGDTFSVLAAEPANDAPDRWEELDREDDAAEEAECPESGWKTPDPERTSYGDRDAVRRYASRQADYAGTWGRADPGLATEGPLGERAPLVVLAFTDDLERHEAEAREHWGGPLCVVRRERTYRELRRIADELADNMRSDGLDWDSLGPNESRGTVDVHAFLVTPESRSVLDDRYGAGVIRVTAELEPVSP